MGYFHLSLTYILCIEKQLEDEEQLNKNLNKDTKAKFADEDAYDSEEERKKKLEELKKQAPVTKEPKKKAGPSKDYDKMFEDRLNKNKGGQKTAG